MIRRSIYYSVLRCIRYMVLCFALGFILIGPCAAQAVKLENYPDASGEVPFQFADLDGNGSFEFLVKRNQFQHTYPVITREKLYAYDRQGKMIWSFLFNAGVFPGLYGSSPVAAIDADGDGKDEVYVVEAAGSSDYQESIKKLSPANGSTLASADIPRRIDSTDDYNFHRVYTTSAYLDGYDKLPSIVLVRGWFGSISVWAYDKDLNVRWKWEAASGSAFGGTGSATSPVAADLNGDGKEDIFIGSAAISSSGQPMWVLGGTPGASDGSALGEFNPNNPGLEVYTGPNGGDGGQLGMGNHNGDWIANWGKNHVLEHTGLIADLDLSKPGFEVYGRLFAPDAEHPEGWFLYDAQGNDIPNNYEIPTYTQIPLAAWWDGTARMDILGVGAPGKEGFTQVGDIQGDWREEVITGKDGVINIHNPYNYLLQTPGQVTPPKLRGDKFYYKELTAKNGYYTRPTLLAQIGNAAASPAGRIARMDNSRGDDPYTGQYYGDNGGAVLNGDKGGVGDKGDGCDGGSGGEGSGGGGRSLGNYTSADIGAVSKPSTVTPGNNAVTITTTGRFVADTRDEFHFVYQKLTGGGSITARVVSHSVSNNWARGGVMMRESLDPGAANVAIFATAGSQYSSQVRLSQGADTSYDFADSSLPLYVRLVQDGNTVNTYYSTDGSEFTLHKTYNVKFGDTVYVGIAASSDDKDFDNPGNTQVVDTTVIDNISLVNSDGKEDASLTGGPGNTDNSGCSDDDAGDGDATNYYERLLALVRKHNCQLPDNCMADLIAGDASKWGDPGNTCVAAVEQCLDNANYSGGGAPDAPPPPPAGDNAAPLLGDMPDGEMNIFSLLDPNSACLPENCRADMASGASLKWELDHPCRAAAGQCLLNNMPGN